MSAPLLDHPSTVVPTSLPVSDAPAWQRVGALRSQTEAEDDARAILFFVRNGLMTHDIDPAQPLWIVDLAPGDGERAWLILRYLAERAPRVPMLRYLACCSSEAQRDMLANLAVLQAEVQTGRLVIAGAEEDFLRHDMRNPAVVLAHGACASYEQAWFACHYGDLLEGAWQPDGQIGWAPLQERDGLCSLLPAYCRAINSAPLSLPVGAMQRVQALLAATDGRLLVRASDPGAMNLLQIRQGMLAVDTSTPRVNFEALARWHRALGATVHQSQCDDGGRVLHVAVHDCAGGHLQACLAEMLELPHPDVRAAAVAAMSDAKLDAMACAAWLEQVAADPRVVPGCADALLAAAGDVQGAALRHWRGLLARLCDNAYPGWRDVRLTGFLASFAMRLEDWGRARQLLQQTLCEGGDRAWCWRMLAECHARSGALDAARISLQQADRALDEDALTDDSPARQELRCASEHLAQRLAHQRGRPAFAPALARDGALVLEPLDAEHAADLFYQYRDPQIGMMTRLPEFAGIEALRDWMATRVQQPNRLDCAVMHAERGFVGVVSAHWSEGDAFMHFWIGVDHQGCGFAVPAARLLIRMLTAHGVQRIFTAVYPDNHRSLRALAGVGFVNLSIRAMPPDDEMLFLVRAPVTNPGGRRLAQQLRAFARRTDSAFSFPDEPDLVTGTVDSSQALPMER